MEVQFNVCQSSTLAWSHSSLPFSMKLSNNCMVSAKGTCKTNMHYANIKNLVIGDKIYMWILGINHLLQKETVTHWTVPSAQTSRKFKKAFQYHLGLKTATRTKERNQW